MEFSELGGIVMKFQVTLWCNGSTTGFGPVSLGSSPGRVAKFSKKLCPHLEMRGNRDNVLQLFVRVAELADALG